MLTAPVLTASALAVAGAALAGRLILPGHGFTPAHGYASLTSATDFRAAAGAVLYLTLIALLSLGVAAAVRDSAAAIGLVLGVLYLFPLAAAVISNPALARHLQQIGPLPAGLDAQATIRVNSLPLTPWQGLGVVALWTAGALLLPGLSRPDLVRVLESAAHLQAVVPDAVLVGGSAAALWASHRTSFDHDHVLADLSTRFDTVLEAIEATEGWVTNRVTPGKIILGELGDIESGVRQLIRSRPLEVSEVELPSGQKLRVPTPEETLRIKGYLIVRRNQVRDYLDVAALSDRYGIPHSRAGLRPASTSTTPTSAAPTRRASQRSWRVNSPIHVQPTSGRSGS